MPGSSEDRGRADTARPPLHVDADAVIESAPHGGNTVMVDLAAALLGPDAGTPYAILCAGRWVPLGIRLRVALDVLADVSRRGMLAIATDEAQGALSIHDVHVGMDGVATVRGAEGAHGGAELLWEVLAGEVLRGAPPPLAAVAPDIPRSIVEVVERALTGEMLFMADVQVPFVQAAVPLAAERSDVRRVVAVPASLPSQRPPCMPNDGEAPIDLQRALVVPALAQFTRSQLRTRPAPEELEAPMPGPPAPQPLEDAVAVDGDGAARSARRSSRPLRMVRCAPKPPPGALVVTRRHVDVPLCALVPVVDGRVGQLRALAPIHRSVHAPSFARRRAPLLVLVPAMAAAALVAVAAIGFLARGGAPAAGDARTGVESAAAPVRDDARLAAAALGAAGRAGELPAAAASGEPGSAGPPADVPPAPAREATGVQGDPDGGETVARGERPTADRASPRRPRGEGKARRAPASGARGSARDGDGPAAERAASQAPAGSRAATHDTTSASAPAGARAVQAKPQTERAVHEGVVDPGY